MHTKMRCDWHLALSIVLLSLPALSVSQEMEPNSYAPNPAGVSFVVAGFGETWGDILFDPSLLATDVNARWHNVVAGYGHTFGLFGRLTNVALVVPYVTGTVSGNVDEVFTEISRTGFADPRFRASINLIGNPAMSPAEFATFKPKTTLGLTFMVVPPLGRNFPDKLINIGSNRWSLKTELGVSHPVGRWRWEFAAGVWTFTDNDDFFGGNRRSQNPVVSYQGHLIYTVRPRFWIAFNANWYRGGTSAVNGVDKDDLQSTSRYGLTVAYPLTMQHSLKLIYSDGATTRLGSDYQSLSLIWQYAWF